VLVQVAACGVCGSEVHGYLGRSARRNAHLPLIMGHEFTGRVAAVGEWVGEQVRVGERVFVQPLITCRRCQACQSGFANVCPQMALVGIERPGAFAEFVAVPADRVFPLPDSLSDEEGALVETLAIEVHLFRRMAPPLLRSVAVLGAGAQGLFAVQLARLAGATQVMVSDVVPARLALAERLGATLTIRADQEDVVQRIRAQTDGWGVDFAIDAAGAPVTRQQGVAILQPGGTLGVVGLGIGETTLDFIPVVNRELSIRGCYCYSDDDFVRASELIASGQIRVKEMIHIAPLREGVSYIERLAADPGGLTKVVFKLG